jgi:hypothetical protein
MTAVLLDDLDVVTTVPPTPTPAPWLTLAPERRRAAKRVHRSQIDTSGDPMVDATARLLSIPLRHVYAALWRMGLIGVR